jgi:hypothetical protein
LIYKLSAFSVLSGFVSATEVHWLICCSYLRHVRAATVAEKAGGYQSIIACQRALQDAFCGLCFVAPDSGDGIACS